MLRCLNIMFLGRRVGIYLVVDEHALVVMTHLYLWEQTLDLIPHPYPYRLEMIQNVWLNKKKFLLGLKNGLGSARCFGICARLFFSSSLRHK